MCTTESDSIDSCSLQLFEAHSYSQDQPFGPPASDTPPPSPPTSVLPPLYILGYGRYPFQVEDDDDDEEEDEEDSYDTMPGQNDQSEASPPAKATAKQ